MGLRIATIVAALTISQAPTQTIIKDGTAVGGVESSTGSPGASSRGLVTRQAGTAAISGTVAVCSASNPAYSDGASVPLSVDTSGRIRITTDQVITVNVDNTVSTLSDDSVGSPVSPYANTAGWSDGTSTRIPRVVDADTGAGTEYNAACMLRAPASGGSVDLPIVQGASSTGKQLLISGGNVTTAPPAYTNGTSNAISLDTNGNARTWISGGLVSVDQFGGGTTPFTVIPVSIIGAIATSDVGGTTEAAVNQMGGKVTTAAPVYTNNTSNILSMDTSGNIRTTLGTGSNVVGSLTANQSINLTQIAGSAVSAGNGASGTGALRVTVASDSSGTLACTQATASSLNAEAQGDAPHSAPVSGNPIQLGAYAESDAASLDSTGVVEGDITRLKADIEGRLLVTTHHPNRWHASSGLSTATTLTQIQAAPGASLSLYVTGFLMSASVASTTTTDQQLTLKYGTGSNCVTGTTYITGCFNAANDECSRELVTPIKIPANNALCWIHAAAGSKIISVTGHTAP